MASTEVAWTTNGIPINVSVHHVTGPVSKFVLHPGMALIDDNGVIRFFSVDWEELGHQGYLLLPYDAGYGDTKAVAIADFIASAGVTIGIARGTRNALQARFVFNSLGGKKFIHRMTSTVASFIAGPNYRLGYHNIATHRLEFNEMLTVTRW